MNNQPLIDGGVRGVIASGLGGIVSVVVLLSGAPPVVAALLTPTCLMVGFLAGGWYDGHIRKPPTT